MIMKLAVLLLLFVALSMPSPAFDADRLNWGKNDTGPFVQEADALDVGELKVPDDLYIYYSSGACHAEWGRTNIWIDAKGDGLYESGSGILVFFDSRMRQLMDLKIFMDCDADIRFVRRLKRDMRDRGRSVESVIDQYLSTVRPMHLQFVEPTRRYAGIVLAGDGSNDADMESIIGRIHSFWAASGQSK